jgi:hypothetical protein
MKHNQLVPFDGLVFKPPFRGERPYIKAADIFRALEDSIFLKTHSSGSLQIELRSLVDCALVLVCGFSANALVRLRWSDGCQSHLYSLERVESLVPLLPGRLPEYELLSTQDGDFLKLLDSSGLANLFECVVDAAKRLLPAPEAHSRWLVRSVSFDLTSSVSSGDYFKVSYDVLRSGLVRWFVDDQDGRRVMNSTSYLYRPTPDLSIN